MPKRPGATVAPASLENLKLGRRKWRPSRQIRLSESSLATLQQIALEWNQTPRQVLEALVGALPLEEFEDAYDQYCNTAELRGYPPVSRADYLREVLVNSCQSPLRGQSPSPGAQNPAGGGKR